MTGFIYVERSIEAPLDRHRAFLAAAAMDAVAIIRAHGPIPGVASLEGHTGPWTETGQERVVRLSNGDSVHEILDVYLPGVSFAYDVREFTGLFGMLVHEAFSEFIFEDAGPGRSRVLWRYTFAATEPFFRPLLWAILRGFYGGFMKAALLRFRETLDASVQAPPALSPTAAMPAVAAEPDAGAAAS